MGLRSWIRFVKAGEENKRAAALRRSIAVHHIEKLMPDLVVKNGIFTGMKYPGMKSTGSTLFPKLLGSYERELADVLETISKKSYTSVVDVGCAEGYYAVGLALKLESAHIYAFDVNEKARKLTQKMFHVNGIGDDRYTIGEFCSRDTFADLDLGERSLIICDCEGYEKELFDEGNVAQFKQHELLIETHDVFDINISTYLYDLFNATHDIHVIESVDDIQKAKTYQYEELEGCSLEERKTLLGERRRSIMEWFYMVPKS